MYRKGFALFEIIVVIAILALIAGSGFYLQTIQNRKTTVEKGLDAQVKALDLKKQVEGQARQEEQSLNQVSGSVRASSTEKSNVAIDTSSWRTYSKFANFGTSTIRFMFPRLWHLTEYPRGAQGIVAVKLVPSQDGGVSTDNSGTFSFNQKGDSDYILVYREFMAQPECTYLTRTTEQMSEGGKIITHQPEWPDTKCVEPFELGSSHYLPYAIFTPSKDSEILRTFDLLVKTAQENPAP